MFSTSIGKKIVMAVTGLMLLLFLTIHLLGNSSIFAGAAGINAYAHHLHSMPVAVIAGFRFFMLAIFCLHIILALQITIENRMSSSQAYAVKAMRKTTFASENMIWSGLIILLFVLYHLAQFTFQVTPGLVLEKDVLGNFDVYKMVTTSFSSAIVTLVYVVAMIALFLHLYHGVQSFFQTLGLSNDKTQPALIKFGMLAALVFLIGYSAIPLSVLVGILKG